MIVKGIPFNVTEQKIAEFLKEYNVNIILHAAIMLLDLL